MAIAHTYNPVTHDYVASAEDHGYTPSNATNASLPPRPWTRQWPRWTGKKWEMVEDHRERKAPAFRAEDAQAATEFWLPGDGHDTPSRQVFAPGPLPEGAALERPAQTAEQDLAAAKEVKTSEIEAGYQKAMAATLTMPQASPTSEDVAVGAALFAAEDAEGLEYVVGQHGATREALLDQVASADSLAAVEAVEVHYAV
ncbi:MULTISPECIES: phage tail protein [unclassified Desulfovibrio]|uniref:phage tail protein n=1 Tax=unclassified Desulfovibrio TaxID=2593640 RepID=UPI0013EC1D40|nr:MULTISPECIES: phage tail protein [unclassified Desulfovibrio]